MTVSGYSTASTIEPPPRPDREQDFPAAAVAPRPSLAAIVASLHGRAGKTLFARIVADYFAFSGGRPFVFDTDITEQTLRAAFPFDTTVVDLTETRDQMALFDTVAAPAPDPRVVDVSHYVFRRFFKLMEGTDFVSEARTRQVEPVIFYIAGRNPDAYEEGVALRERFDCPLVLVENAFLGSLKDRTLRSAGYRAFEAHELCMTLSVLDPAIAEAIEDPLLSLSEIMRRPLSRGDEAGADGLNYDQLTELRRWLMTVFRDIHRVTRAAQDLRASRLVPVAPI